MENETYDFKTEFIWVAILAMFISVFYFLGHTVEYNQTTEAVTFNHRIEKVTVKKGKSSKYLPMQIIDYVYFINNKKYQFTHILGKPEESFKNFLKPQVCILKYDKNNPQNHDILLEQRLDTINNTELYQFTLEHFKVKSLSQLLN